jgi:hypothetical protein
MWLRSPEQVLVYRKFVPAASATEESRRVDGTAATLCTRARRHGESTFCSKLQTMPPVLCAGGKFQADSWLKELNFILLKLEWDRFSKLNR